MNADTPAQQKALEIAQAFLAKRFPDPADALDWLTQHIGKALEEAESAGAEKIMLSKRRDR